MQGLMQFGFVCMCVYYLRVKSNMVMYHNNIVIIILLYCWFFYYYFFEKCNKCLCGAIKFFFIKKNNKKI